MNEPPDSAARRTPPSISVTGTGRVWVTPDLADLRLGVAITARTVAEARAANASAMEAVLASLGAAGVADRDIQTSSLVLSPVYDYSKNTQPPPLVGYSHANVVEATIRDLGQIAAAVDGALAAGATSLDGLTFRVDDPYEAERAARVAAVEDARAKAETLATAAGVAIAGVVEITEVVPHGPIPFPMQRKAALMAEDAATPIEGGQNEIVVSVAVTYRIG